MINIGIIEKDLYKLQELETFIKSQREFVCLFAVTAEKLLDLPPSNYPNLVVLISDNDVTQAHSTGNRIRTVQQRLPKAAIIVLSKADHTDIVLSALRAGALGYLHFDTPLLQIKEAITHVLAGGAFLSPAIARKVTDYFRLETPPESCTLTNREKEIVSFLIQGLSYKMIAFNLDLSIDTVRFHLRNIYKKLHVTSKAAVISKILKQELLIR